MPRDEIADHIEWRVIWFPPDRKDVIRTGTEAQVRKMAERNAPWNPIIEKREVVVTQWESVNDAAGD